MRKRSTFALARVGLWPSEHHEPSCTRLSIGAAMNQLQGGRSSRLSLMLLVFIILNSVWFMTAGAAPVTAVSSYTGSDAASRTPLSRCPAIFNPISMIANSNVSGVSSSAKQGLIGRSKSTQSPSSSPSCRYFLKKRFGTLTTPGFPSAFPLPCICSWIIDATGFEPESFITLYLTQMYLTRGVKAVQYSFRNETHAVGRKELDELHAHRPRPYSVYRIKARYLEVQVNLDELVNANLRVERRLMDVYGFNITYEIQPNGSRIRSDTCNVVNCTFNGHCYANHNYSQFQCSCLPNFSGKYCQHGPECNPEKGINVCKNGGVCGYRIGISVVRCSCPPNYNGSLCEFRREFIPAKECLSKLRLSCSHHCVVTDKGIATCRCPQNQALRSDNSTCYPLVPLRILGQVELERPNCFNDTRLVEGVTAAMRKMAEEFTALKLVVGSVNLFEPNSSRLQFILWNSEKYNMSWTNAVAFHGSMDASRNGSHLIVNQSSLGQRFPWNSGRKKMTRDEDIYIPQQWNNSYTSFVHQINSRAWKVQGETIAIRNISVVQVPALIIEWVKLDVKGQVREGYPFTVACNANGSGKKDLKMGWYKDGHPIDDSFALQRNMSIFVHQQQDLRGFFTLYLEVKQASLFDRGEFECRAKDWGQTARKSVFLDVITPPILDLMPMNPVVLPGTAVNLTCRDENHLARRTTTKYVWLKNGQPIESSCEEIIEDLTPVGSLLRITSIQHSTNYTCRGENGTKVANKTTQVFVASEERSCPQQKSHGVEWLRTAFDITNYQFCPAGYVGVAKRHCFAVKELPDDGGETLPAIQPFWSWGEPDFSNCSDRELTEVYHQLKLITLGYVVTDLTSIVNKFADFIEWKLKGIAEFNRFTNWKNRTDEEATPAPYLPGEGNMLLEMAISLEVFLWRRTEVLPHSFWNSTAVRYLYALDALLSMPRDIFRLNGELPILRFIQNHLTLLGINPKGEYLLGSIQRHLLKNSDLNVDNDRKQFKYKGRLPVLPSQAGFKNLSQLAPAQFFLNKQNGYNFSIDFHSVEHLQIQGGEYHCALLLLQPTNHSRGWDMDSCFIERLSDPAAFRCHCAHQGTVVLLYAVRDIEETENSVVNLWKVIYFAASVSHLAVVFGLVTLCAMWYQRRCVWLWFQIQVGISLLPPSSIYFLQTDIVITNRFWASLLTAAIYQYATTVWAMIMYLKMSATKSPTEQATTGKLSQNNIRLVGLSLGVPLTLSGVQILIEEFSVGVPFITWFSQLSSFSGIFFSLAYSTLFFTVLSLYVTSTREPDDSAEKSKTFTKDVSLLMSNIVRHSHCCPMLALLGVLVTGSTLCRFHWLSLSTHCVAALLHLLAVLLAVPLMLNFSSTKFFCLYWCFWRRNKLPQGETMSELLNATAMVESPQRKSLLSTDQHPSEGLERSAQARRINRPCLDDTPFPVHNRIRRFYRCGPASSSLLQRAGLGPDVRALSLEQESTHQLLDNSLTALQADISPTEAINGSGDLTEFSRDRINSTSSDGMQQDDLDSGFGPSGGGGSQKMNGLDKYSDAWKVRQMK
uniref:Brain-specific angiogenesis inhibitor n=1 Tax=Daphnia magna TaxID=35525 RepID=A0A0P6EIG7_9CRUS